MKKTAEGLERVIGVSGLSLTILNFTIGAGIFVLPAIVGIQLGTYGLLCYVFCAILLGCVMLCYAEIGSKVTSSGGTYAYVVAAFGKFPGFITNWLFFFAFDLASCGAVMNIIADSLAVISPAFLNPWLRACLFFILIAFMVIMNVRGTKQSIAFIKFVTVIKLLPLVAIIIFGFFHVKTSNLHWGNLPTLNAFGNTALVLFFAFLGFESALTSSGEIKNPKRTIPRGIILAGLLILAFYLLLQTVTQGVLGANMAAVKDAPLAAIAEKMVGPVGAIILLLTAAFSCFTNIFGDVLASPRLLFAGANDGLFPKFLSKVHPKFATPYLAIIVWGALIFIFSVSGGFKQMAILASASILIIYLTVILATIKMRTKKQEASEKTFRIPGGLTVPLIGIAAIGWIFTSLGKWEILSVLIFIAVVCVIYFVMKKVKKEKIRFEPVEEIL
ncbi:MAG: APC family permease [Ginsengibacter sp.]